jgi:hypothetical protein
VLERISERETELRNLIVDHPEYALNYIEELHFLESVVD